MPNAWFWVVLLVAILAISIIKSTYRGLLVIPHHLPWPGLKDGLFPEFRARIASVNDGLGYLGEGYRMCSSQGQSFVWLFFGHREVVLPRSYIKWMISQNDETLSSHEMQRDSLQTDWTMFSADIISNPVHEAIIQKFLTPAIASTSGDISDEIAVAFAEHWGHPTDAWQEVHVFNTMTKIVSRASNRAFVGLPLCRNENYLYNAMQYAQDIAISAGLLRMIPPLVRPLLAWIFVIPNRWHFSRATGHLFPLIKQRLEETSTNPGTEATDPVSKPRDLITWMRLDALRTGNAVEQQPRRIAHRIMVLNFAAIHTSSFAMTNVLLDLFSSPLATRHVESIRKEVLEVLNETGGQWTKAGVAKMVRTDSAIRESLRVSSFMSHGIPRKVVSPNGITLPDGTYLPPGTTIATSAYPIQHDEDIYEDAYTYDAFRFCSVDRESNKSDLKSEDSKTPHWECAHLNQRSPRNISLVTTGDAYLSFGHGRHACPGRFFAAHMMKIMLAHIILEYDIMPLKGRPTNRCFGGNVLPPLAATISIRKRAC
ncbi:hypothetical protein LTR56_019893 [Elasticomyces elasticus]|nr:hypothetical protein LTR56_019893 [Elasticomyces elasticus]KAK3642346.1 hypothetical protein LTR22_016161 [Elasticomyces elasticus]KAK4914421.1 hypothetical protein LTR49_017341 [Elasticomyces elasticus]KAK5760397.1 hypothetical protein LTS12_009441 [Elasticomyces elasticus]